MDPQISSAKSTTPEPVVPAPRSGVPPWDTASREKKLPDRLDFGLWDLDSMTTPPSLPISAHLPPTFSLSARWLR
ncbi:MAG: hypothetical protein ABI073_09705 [Luteolibacter sp.]